MSFEDKRNVLRTGPQEHPGETEIMPAMVETVRQRIKDAGGIPPGGPASKLLTGSGHRKDGPQLSLS